ncbi:MAG: SLC45 family MFS transporter [Betaproteobacteria bacterium]|nr:MAG: SLC45 family MFS transporter [Betaproteobacteria bacterium]
MALAVYVGVVQFLFGTTWTLYVIYLPQLAQNAGIGREWVPWILVADQLAFAAMDVVTGFWVDRVRAGYGRFGGWIVAGAVLSAFAFLTLPYAGASANVLLVAIAIWALTSSALRSPPWALLSRHAATPSMPWLSTLVLTGTAVASALAPYLGVALRGVDPRVPFIVSTLTLLATVVGLMLAERRLPAHPPAEAKPLPPVASPALFAALLLLALGFQVHFGLSSAQRYAQFAPREQLAYLMPVFWIGFNLLMFPAARVVKRLGVADAMALAAALGALAMLLTLFAPGLAVLVAAQFLAGGCWGAASVAAYSAAVALGRTGREGRFLGTLFAVLAVAVAARIALAGSGMAQSHLFSALQPWLPQTLWLCGALVLLAGRFR